MTRSAGARTALALAAVLLVATGRSSAEERQIRPFVGATFGGSTTFVDPEDAVGSLKLSIGASAVFLGELLGAEIDLGDVPGYFENGQHLVVSSRVTTLSGNVVVAAPHSRTEYSLRPYFVAGGGLMRVRKVTSFNVFDVRDVLPQIDIGGGVVGFLTNTVGVAWDVRRFQTVGGGQRPEFAPFGSESLSFWRANMAIVIRY
jgi:hypothetical protein